MATKSEQLAGLRQAVVAIIHAGPGQASNGEIDEILQEASQIGWQDGYDTGYAVRQRSVHAALTGLNAALRALVS